MAPLLFLSHAGADTEAAHALTRAIESAPDAQAAGLKVWLDKRDLVPGREWQPQLEHAIAQQATAFAVLVDTRGTVNWVEREVRLALSRATSDSGFPFIPLLVGEAKSRDLPPFAQQYHAARGTAATDPDLLRGLLRAVLQPEARDFRPALESHPFVGLRAFEEGEARLFFGRERETQELVGRLADTPLIMVVGDSGSGKSSLVKAGLVPAFRGGALADLGGDQPDPRRWHVVSLRPRGAPFDGLTEAVAEAARRAGLGLADIDHLRVRIRRRDAQSIRDALTDAAPSPKLVLLVIDQFEELWTQTSDDDRRAFVEVVAALRASAGQDLRLVLTMRRDYYYQVSEFPEFFAQLEAADGRAKFVTRRMANEAMRDAILKPLSLTDAWNEAAAQNLAERVLRDAGDRPGDLALVQMALAEAWRARGEGQDLLAAYLRRGGVAGALAQAAQEVLDRKLAGEPEPSVRGVFLRLARLGEAGGATRRIARRDEFDADGWAIVQRLAGPELLAGDVGASTRPLARLVAIAGEPNEETAEILHEALFTQWPPYVRWLREWGADKRTLDRLADDVAEWRKDGVAARPLAIGADLEVFRALRDGAETGIWLSPDERRFVDESEQAQNAATERAAAQAAEVLRLTNARADAERARAHEAARSAKRARWFTAGAALLAVLSAVAAFVARHYQAQSEEAARRAIENEAVALTALSDVARREGRAADALRLAVAAWPRNPEDRRPQLARTLLAMGEATALRVETTPPLRHEHPVHGAALSPDGRLVLTLSESEARLWDATTGAPFGEPMRHMRQIRSVAFDPTGRLIVTASGDGTARLWDVASRSPVGAPMRHREAVHSAAFSPDGRLVVTASEDHTARLWDAASGAPVGEPMQHEDTVFSAAFNPDGRLVVTTSGQLRRRPEARLWDTASGAPVGAPMAGDQGRLSAAFSQDGTRIVTWSSFIARVWNALGEPIGQPMPHDFGIITATLSTDGSRVLTSSVHSPAHVWEVVTGSQQLPPVRHDSQITVATFSVDRQRVLIASVDGGARLWNVTPGIPIGAPMQHEGPILFASVDLEMTRLVTASFDGTARIWDLRRGSPIGLPMRHGNSVNSAAFSPSGERVVTASFEGTARLWDAASGSPLSTPMQHGGPVSSATFSADGAMVVTRSSNTATIWDAVSGAPLGTPIHHDEEITSATFSPNGTVVLTASKDRTARLWTAATGVPVGQRMPHGGPVHTAEFSANGRWVVTASSDGTARLWDATTGAPIGTPQVQHSRIIGATLSPDMTRLATASADGTARLWNATTAHQIGETMQHDGVINSVAFSPNGAQVLTASQDRSARLWDAVLGKAIGHPMRHDERVISATFSRDGEMVATASADGTARLWDAATGAPVGAPMLHGDEVRSATFSPDGTRLVTASGNLTARLWDVGGQRGPLPQLACGLLPEIRAGHAQGDRSSLTRYGITIRDPICEAPGPPFDPARIDWR
jgi:WD40 repeat protein